MTYYIYYASVRLAREHGDPLLGEVEASSKEEAEEKATGLGLGDGAEIFATLTHLLPGERIDFSKMNLENMK